MAHDVFISYPSSSIDIAMKVRSALEEKDITCWMAPGSIPPGTQYTDCLIEAIVDARIMLVIFCAEANTSRWVHNEVERANHYGKILVPVFIEDVKPTRGMEALLSGTQWFTAYPKPVGKYLNRLTQDLQAALERQSETLPRTEFRKPVKIANLPLTFLHISILLYVLCLLCQIAVFASDFATPGKMPLLTQLNAAQLSLFYERMLDNSESQFDFYAFTSVLFLLWVRRAYQNIQAFGCGGLDYSPNSAVWAFFIPIVSWFRPYLVVKEIWAASDPLKAPSDITWKSTRPPTLFILWWLCWLFANYSFNIFTSRKGLGLSFYSVLFINLGSCLVTAILTFFITRSIDQRQEEKHSFLRRNNTSDATFVPTSLRGEWLTVILAGVSFMEVIEFLWKFLDFYLVYRHSRLTAEMLGLSVAQGPSDTESVVLLPVLFALFLSWVYRKYSNLSRLKVGGLRCKPDMAVGWFFVPVINLFMPYLIIKQLWQASDPEQELSKSSDWRQLKSPRLIGWWAAFTPLFLAFNLWQSNVVSALPGGEVYRIRIDFVWGGLSDVLLGLFCFLTLRIVVAIDERQRVKWERMRQSDVSSAFSPITPSVRNEYLIAGLIALFFVVASFMGGRQLWPGDDYYKSIGDNLAGIGCPHHAEEAYRVALTLNPKNGQVHAGLAAILLKEGRRSEAITEAQQAQRNGVTDDDVYKQLGLRK